MIRNCPKCDESEEPKFVDPREVDNEDVVDAYGDFRQLLDDHEGKVLQKMFEDLGLDPVFETENLHEYSESELTITELRNHLLSTYETEE